MENVEVFNEIISSIMPKLSVFRIIDNKRIIQIDQMIQKFVKDNKIVGLAVGISQRDDIMLRKGYGFQDPKNKIPVSPSESLFRWASMSKMITSIITLKLLYEHKIELSQDVKKFYKNFFIPNRRIKKCMKGNIVEKIGDFYHACLGGYVEYETHKTYFVNFEHLLSNRSGICSYDNTKYQSYPKDKDMKDKKIHTKHFSYFLKYALETPYVSNPGEKYNYTTFGFNFLGYLLELVSGASYMELFNKYINIDGKYRTIIPDKEVDKHLYPNRVKGYKNGKLTDDTDVSFKLPGGGFMSNLDDALLLCNNLKTHLTLYEKMIAWRPISREATYSYGLGFMIWKDYKTKRISIGHTGSQQKTSTFLKYFPRDDICIVGLSNEENFPNKKFRKMVEKNLYL